MIRGTEDATTNVVGFYRRLLGITTTHLASIHPNMIEDGPVLTSNKFNLFGLLLMQMSLIYSKILMIIKHQGVTASIHISLRNLGQSLEKR